MTAQSTIIEAIMKYVYKEQVEKILNKDWRKFKKENAYKVSYIGIENILTKHLKAISQSDGRVIPFNL